jgi:hypothetical protein
MDETGIVPDNGKGTPETSIASTLIPWDRDDEKALYFGARASGLSVRESLHFIKRSKAWLSGCRHDPVFVDLESKIPDFRRDLAKEYVELHTYRNYFMVLERDKQVLEKAIKPNRADPLTRQEQEYLIKLRTMYTPAHLQIIESLVKGGKDGFNFTEFIMNHPDIIQMSRTDTITVAKRPDDG